MERTSVTPGPEGLRALSHPGRLRMLGLLRTEGPATATTLAARLHRPPVARVARDPVGDVIHVAVEGLAGVDVGTLGGVSGHADKVPSNMRIQSLLLLCRVEVL